MKAGVREFDKAMVISKKENQKLSAQQKKFNKLTASIRQVELDIEKREAFLNKFLVTFHARISPLKRSVAERKLQIATGLDTFMQSGLCAKTKRKEVRECILLFLNEAFESLQPNEDQINLFNRYSQTTYEEELENQEMHAKNEMEDFLKFMFNVEVDLSEMDLNNPEDKAKLKEIVEGVADKNGAKNGNRPAKKTKKQIEKERIEKEKEELRAKSLKSIYFSLSKALHPDLESNPVLKMEKEEAMKKLTVAYQEGNFPELLKMEAEWMHETSAYLNDIGEDKLKIYNAILEEKLSNLKMQFMQMDMHGRYEPVSNILCISQSHSLRLMNQLETDIKNELEKMQEAVAICNGKNKKEIYAFVEEVYLGESSDLEPFDIFDYI